MRYVMITYHMAKVDPELGTATETAETCIRLPRESPTGQTWRSDERC